MTDADIEIVLRGTPAWITVAAIRDTISTFEPDYGKQISPDDALSILLNVGNLFSVLKSAPKNDRQDLRTK